MSLKEEINRLKIALIDTLNASELPLEIKELTLENLLLKVSVETSNALKAKENNDAESTRCE